MKRIIATLPALLFSLAAYADAAPDVSPKTSTPFIEYNNRMSVFSPLHQVYERTKPNAFYAGVEGWFACPGVAEGDLRMGYNFFWNGRDHFTPFAGVGVFKDIHHHHHHHSKPAIVYGAAGFLYDHEFTSWFTLGLNVKGMLGGAVSEKHFDWGSPVGGADVALPITFRFGKLRHWDYRIEPFNICLHGSNATQNYFGFRNTIGYRF